MRARPQQRERGSNLHPLDRLADAPDRAAEINYLVGEGLRVLGELSEHGVTSALALCAKTRKTISKFAAVCVFHAGASRIQTYATAASHAYHRPPVLYVPVGQNLLIKSSTSSATAFSTSRRSAD
jgi:hypothetical protein